MRGAASLIGTRRKRGVARFSGASAGRVRRDLIEECVFELLQHVVFTPGVAQRIKSAAAAKTTGRSGTQRRLTKRLAAVEAKLERARRNLAIADSDDLSTIKTVLRELKHERDELQSGLSELSIEDTKEVLADAVAAVRSSREWFADPDPAFRPRSPQSFLGSTLR